MRYKSYLAERLWQLVLLAGVVAAAEIFLMTLQGSLALGIYLALSMSGFYFLITYLDFLRKKRWWEEVLGKLSALDKKYLLPELLDEGGLTEERALLEVVSCMGKAMVDEVNFYKHESEEYKEYIELWIHEVKLPIAAGRLIVENNRNPVTQSLEEELEKIEAYTEQALFYARSAQVEKDYQIGRVLLRDVVSQVVKRNKRELIALHTSISMEGLDVTVYSDGKWLAFILNQLVSNSIKYADKEHLELSFLAEECPEQIVLTIRDNGQGIADRDLPRIFEKGFTGSAVRESRKSTGIGLYLCEKLCKKLGHAIEAESKEGEGVSIRLIFPRGSFNLQN